MNLLRMKPALLWLLLLWQIDPHTAAAPVHLRYQRPVILPPGSAADTQACAVLDAPVFAHAAPSLRDLRLYTGAPGSQTELPYATTLSESQQQESEDARILNLGLRNGHIVFDLEMPHRAYTGLTLDLALRDFIATAAVSGSDAPGGKATPLGTFTLFDLTSQHLARSTTIPLPESVFPYLHLELTLAPASRAASSPALLRLPAIVKSATVPPSRDAQTVYVPSQQTSSLVQLPTQTVATFQLPLRVPVERIAFLLKPGYEGEFSRTVNISAQGLASTDVSALRDEEVTGTIFRVHRSDAGHELAAQTLSVPVAIGSNMQQPANLRVAVQNGPDAPLPVATVQLQMRQRRICFEATASAAPLTLYYGDPTLEAPAYSYASRFRPAPTPLLAALGAETPNPAFQPRADSSTLTSRHPDLLWVSFLATICAVALIAIHSAKRRGR
jgi:hypothetical protein